MNIWAHLHSNLAAVHCKMLGLTIPNEANSGIYGEYIVEIIIYINVRNIIAKMYTLTQSLLIYE